jgi:excisionase family DNA binding protein
MKTAPAPALTAVNLDDRNGDIGQDDLLTVDEAARFLHVPVSWVYEHARTGSGDRLPVIKVGKYLRFDRSDLRAYVDAKRAESTHLRPGR